MTIAGDLEVAICEAFDTPYPDGRALEALKNIFRTLRNPDFMTFYEVQCEENGVALDDFLTILDALKTKVLR